MADINKTPDPSAWEPPEKECHRCGTPLPADPIGWMYNEEQGLCCPRCAYETGRLSDAIGAVTDHLRGDDPVPPSSAWVEPLKRIDVPHYAAEILTDIVAALRERVRFEDFSEFDRVAIVEAIAEAARQGIRRGIADVTHLVNESADEALAADPSANVVRIDAVVDVQEDQSAISREDALLWLNDRQGRLVSLDVGVDTGDRTARPVGTGVSELRHWREVFPDGLELDPERRREDLAGLYYVGPVAFDLSDPDLPCSFRIETPMAGHDDLVIDLADGVEIRLYVHPETGDATPDSLGRDSEGGGR